MAAQATLWQLASCDVVRVGETVKASVAKLCGDPLCLRELLLVMLNRGSHRLRLMRWEDLPPPIDVGGRSFHGDQGVGEQGRGHPLADEASRRPAVGAAGYASSIFADGQCLLHLAFARGCVGLR